MTTSPVTAFPTRKRIRRTAQVGLVIVAVVIVATLVAWLFVPSLSIPSWRLAGWQLAQGLDGHAFVPGPTTTVIPVNLNRWPACDQYQTAGSWLAPPQITYAPWSVTITLYSSDSFKAAANCGGWYGFWGQPVDVQLSEPLGGRLLLDGSTLPPRPRP